MSDNANIDNNSITNGLTDEQLEAVNQEFHRELRKNVNPSNGLTRSDDGSLVCRTLPVEALTLEMLLLTRDVIYDRPSMLNFIFPLSIFEWELELDSLTRDERGPLFFENPWYIHGLAMFGLAQLCGASQEVLNEIVQNTKLLYGKPIPCDQWLSTWGFYEMVPPSTIEAFRPAFRCSLGIECVSWTHTSDSQCMGQALDALALLEQRRDEALTDHLRTAVTSRKLKAAELEDKSCSICYEDMTPDATAAITRCNHSFCEPCHDHWIESCEDQHADVTCPMCRGDLKYLEPWQTQFLESWEARRDLGLGGWSPPMDLTRLPALISMTGE